MTYQNAMLCGHELVYHTIRSTFLDLELVNISNEQLCTCKLSYR